MISSHTTRKAKSWVSQCGKQGTVRETFAITHLSENHLVEYGKDKGDFKVDDKYHFEIGGKDKGFNQIADLPDSYIFADDIESPVGAKLPLWMLGFLY